MSPSKTIPTTAARLRTSRVLASAQSDRPVTVGAVSEPGSTAPSAMTSASIVADAGVDHRVEDVDNKVEDKDEDRNQHHRAHHEGIVAVQRAFDEVAPDAGQR